MAPLEMPLAVPVEALKGGTGLTRKALTLHKASSEYGNESDMR